MNPYAKPKTVDEALALLAARRWRVLAGGTDFYPAQGVQPIRDAILDINGLAELGGMKETPTHHVIGARTRWCDIAQGNLPAAFDALRQAALEVGSVQIQNAGTVGGNLCNASPAADGVPPLLALDAEVELRSVAATRHVPLGAFILGNRKTVMADEEMLTAIRVPKASARGKSAFVKLGARRYMVISIAMAAARLELDDRGGIVGAAVSVGSCSAVALRLGGLEASLRGASADAPSLSRIVQAADLSALAPIDDVRASGAYRLDAARELVLRALQAACRTSDRPATVAA